MSEINKAKSDYARADQSYRNAKGWLPFQCDSNCMRLYNKQQLAYGRVLELEARRDELIREARGTVGIWSTIGVGEVRDSFWRAWEQGKETAKRWTMMDAFFMAFTPGTKAIFNIFGV